MPFEVPLAVLDTAARHGARPAVTDARGTMTYDALARQVTREAERLRRAGVGPGDAAVLRVAGEGATAYTALLALGLTGAATLVLGPHLPRRLQGALARAAAPTVLVTAGLDAPVTELHRRTDPREPWTDGTWLLVPTSGTTGAPRLVRLTETGVLAATQVYLDRVDLAPADTSAVVLSLSTVGALPSAALPALLTGGRALLCAGSSPRAFLSALRKEQVAFATSYTAWWEACLAVPGLARLPALRVLAAGGAPWQPLVPAAARRFAGTRVLGIYGATQTHGPGVHAWGEDLAEHSGTAGRPTAGLDVRIDGDGEEGQVLLRGPLVAPGYVDGPLPTTPDGWYTTGDLGRLDGGWLTLTGRLDEVLNLGGRKVHPGQVEAVVAEHPDVARVAVVRVDVPVPRLVAYVVALPGRVLTAGAVRAWVRERMGAYAAPRVVVLDAELPLTPGGKVDRVALVRASAK